MRLVLPLLALLFCFPAATQAADAMDVDTTDAPELADFGAKVKLVAEKWYPIIIEKLSGEGFVPPEHVTIVFRKDYRGVAGTKGDRITASVDYFTKHPDDVGAFVHELVHVVQAYKKKNNVPGWLTEGIADYIRWFNYEPADKRPHPNLAKARYDGSYRTSASFLFWASETYDHDLVKKVNASCRAGQYSAELWKTLTGKTIEESNDAWLASLRGK